MPEPLSPSKPIHSPLFISREISFRARESSYSKHRFSSSYSDFRTRYTAVYSTNEVEAKSEYYCLDPDDGLTMNLGINPLLQYGLLNTREVLLTNILNAIAIVDYVPFDSSTIGNPALDPMDVVRFTGGHADSTAISCITSITYKIHGKHSLKGVGKNPLLSSAKSKADKNIIGLLNQVETSKYVVCAYENATPLMIGSEPTRIIDVTFASIESTSVLFIGNVHGTVEADEETVQSEYKAGHLVPTVDSIIAKAVAEAKEEEEIPEIEYEAVEDELPIQAPPFVYFDDKNIDVNTTSFMFGRDILAKCVLDEGKNEVSVYLPKGEIWYLGDKCFDGGQKVEVNIPEDEAVPFFVKGGCVLPFDEGEYGFRKEEKLEFTVYPIKSGVFCDTFFTDDGESYEYKNNHCTKLKFTVECNEKEVVVKYENLANVKLTPVIRLCSGDNRKLIV